MVFDKTLLHLGGDGCGLNTEVLLGEDGSGLTAGQSWLVMVETSVLLVGDGCGLNTGAKLVSDS